MKRLSLTLCLLVALTASSWSTLVVDNTVPLSDNFCCNYMTNCGSNVPPLTADFRSSIFTRSNENVCMLSFYKIKKNT